jgi:hypothetical protein
MYIDTIHAGPVALAQSFALAARAPGQCDDSGSCAPSADPMQLMMLAECAGRPYATALAGLLVMNYFRRLSTGTRQKRADCRQV